MENQESTPIQPQPAEQSIPQATDSKKPISGKWLLIGFIFALVVILIVGGAYFLGKNSTSKISLSKDQISTTTPSPTSDDSANWKTYTNDKLSFSIKYPENWTINDQSYQSGTDQYMGFLIQGPLRDDLDATNGKKAYYIRALKWDSSSKTLIPNENFGSSGEQFVLQKEPGDQAVNEVSVGDDFIKRSAEHILANQILSTFKFTDQTSQLTPATSSSNPPTQVNGASLKNIKYILPSNWNSTYRGGGLELHPVNGGYLFIKVYSYDGTGRREFYCKTVTYCKSDSIFTAAELGNISGYKADALDNSGGGFDYFGEKGNKFYIINSYNPPSPNEFEKNYKLVLDSLVF